MSSLSVQEEAELIAKIDEAYSGLDSVAAAALDNYRIQVENAWVCSDCDWVNPQQFSRCDVCAAPTTNTAAGSHVVDDEFDVEPLALIP